MKSRFLFVFDYGYAGAFYRVFHRRNQRGRPDEFGAVWRKGSGWVAQGNGIMPDSGRFKTRIKAAERMAKEWYA